MSKKIVLLLTAGFLLLATTGVAQAQVYPPQACNAGALTASDTTVVPGQQISVGGCGFAPNTPVAITFESVPQLLRNLLSLPTSSATTESFSTTVVIPTDAPAGGHTLKASGLAADGGMMVASLPVQVLDPDGDESGATAGTTATGGGTGSSSGSLARTGSGLTVALLQAGLALILLGGGLVAVMRRRRTGGGAGRPEPKTN